MFIKKIVKNNKKTDVDYFTYRLCESYRIDDKVRHRNILNVGKLETIRREDFKLLCDRIEQKVKGINPLFPNISGNIEKEAEHIYRRILHEKLLDCTPTTASPAPESDAENCDFRKVDVNSISNEDSRSFGGEWLSKQMLDACGLPQVLSQNVEMEDAEKLIAVEIISRMIHPSSELETSRWLASDSSLCEMLSLRKTPDHRKLYEAARCLYKHKEIVEEHLYKHFAAKYPDKMRICLYDLSNFYFEGRKEDSALARYGRSKEKRSDAKLVSLALLTDGRGFIRRSKIYPGNISEPATLKDAISGLTPDSETDAGLFHSKPVAVMDAGIATEENLTFLRESGFDYICVSRSNLQDYSLPENGLKTVFDNRNHPIELSIATSDAKDDGDLYLYVKSDMKQIKEQSMCSKLTGRFVAELEKIKSSLSKKRGVKEEAAVNRRIGRLLQKYPSIGKLYKIETRVDENKIVVGIDYEQSKPADAAGVYFIRCSQKRLTEELIWEIYNILREIESTFRCLKTDLDIRPIHHQKDENSEAHIFLGIVAYQLVHAIRQGLKQEGDNRSWSTIRNIMSSQTAVTTRMKLENKDSLVLRNVTRPNQEQAKMYSSLNFKQSNPKMRKKAVVPHN
ncbi:MAG: IS1634 family transposase [Chitinispirillales bacterium]|nr:IS1634 family transposase [Chitinispirillales bacterium]